jgi:hypothetical protein
MNQPYLKFPLIAICFSSIILCFSCKKENTSDEEKCSKTCDVGFTLNSDTCECDKIPCTKTCDTGFELNTENCECEKIPCTKTCDAGFELNSETCNCEEIFVPATITVETESATLTDSWKLRTDIAGYSGTGYIVWEGPAQFWKNAATIGILGKLTYKVNITKPGVYQFNWKSYIAKVDASNPNSEHNDSWLRIPDADDFYAVRQVTSIVYPKGSGKTPNPAGENGNGFFKVYMNQGGSWTNTAVTSDSNSHSIFAKFNQAKEYTIEISPRSDYHAIDSFKLTLQKP